MWSQKLIHSSVSFKERRHLLCLKPQSYYCDNDENNLPLSPYTQPFSLGRREEGSEDGGTGDFRAEQDIQPHCALPLHSHPVWTSIPSWSWGGQAVKQSIYSVTELHLNVWQKCYQHKTWNEGKSLKSGKTNGCFVFSEASPEGFYREKRTRESEWWQKKWKNVTRCKKSLWAPS